MLGKSKNQHQNELFTPLLIEYINRNNELALLADSMDWTYFEKAFQSKYSNTGKPSMPIRFMVGCLMLKNLYNLGDETLAKISVVKVLLFISFRVTLAILSILEIVLGR
jgi:transposase, IS5 family